MNWPILNADRETGVTILDIAEKLDAGDIYDQEKIPIGPRMNVLDLSAQLAALSYGLLKKVLQQIKDGKLRGIPQDESKVTFAPMLEKKNGEITFDKPALEIDRKVRGLRPWPGCHFFFKGERIALLETDLPETEAALQKPGTILTIDKRSGITIATTEGALTLVRVIPEGKKTMSAIDFANGRHLVPGIVLE